MKVSGEDEGVATKFMPSAVGAVREDGLRARPVVELEAMRDDLLNWLCSVDGSDDEEYRTVYDAFLMVSTALSDR